MKKNILLLSLVALFNLNAKAQCPTSIQDDQLDGSSYIFTLASSADCSLYPIPPIAVNTITLSGTDPVTGMAATPLYGVTDCATLPNGVTQLLISANAGTVSLYSGSISFTVNGSLCTFAQVVLPITLVSFEGKALEKSNLLTWRTASETQNKGFDIERSTDGTTFHNIGQVKGNNKPSSYQFVDHQPFATSYYRLRQIDFDGTETLSKVVSVELKGKGKGLKVYPTLVSNVLTADYTEGSLFQVINLLGQQVLVGKTTPQIDVSSLAKGTYILKVGSEVAKFVKQ